MKTDKQSTENLWNTKNVCKFVENRLDIVLDDWQKDYIMHERDTVVRAGRQSGKSFAESLRVAIFALRNEGSKTLIIASVDRQSIELLEKVKSHIMQLYPYQIQGRPTFHKIELKNGSKIMAEPAGQTGYGLRGFTVDKLVADEAHYIPDAVFVAIRPMLATTGGTLDLLSTPRGNEGFFYECFQDESFYKIHIKSEDCPRITNEFLTAEKGRMTKLEFCQEYEAEFLDSLMSFFPKDLIEECISEGYVVANPSHYLGVDFGGYGGDENAFVSLANENKKSAVVNIQTTTRVKAWETVNKIIRLNEKFKYTKIGVDDGGLGTPILDYMLTHDSIKRKCIGLNNANRSITHDGRHKKLLKEDMYGNLKLMMEQGLIIFPNNEELIRSLVSIQFEVDKDTRNIKIHGKYSHITEGLIRAAWLIKTKGLNIYVY